jgi:hypothetical protein
MDPNAQNRNQVTSDLTNLKIFGSDAPVWTSEGALAKSQRQMDEMQSAIFTKSNPPALSSNPPSPAQEASDPWKYFAVRFVFFLLAAELGYMLHDGVRMNGDAWIWLFVGGYIVQMGLLMYERTRWYALAAGIGLLVYIAWPLITYMAAQPV